MSLRLLEMAIGTCCPVNSCIKSAEYLDIRKLRNQRRRSWHREIESTQLRFEPGLGDWNLRKEKEVRIRKLLASRWTDANLSPSTLSRIWAPVNGFRLHILTGDKRIFGFDLKRLSFWILPSYESSNIGLMPGCKSPKSRMINWAAVVVDWG